MAKYFLFLIVPLWLLTGCSAPKAVVQKLYLIQLPNEEPLTQSTAQSDPMVNGLCLVNNVIVAPAFAGEQIALRNRTHQIEYFDNHRWAVQPSEQLFNIMVNYLSQQNIFAQVAGRFWKSNPSYTISTDIFNIEVNNLDKDFTARLNLRFVLTRTRDNKVLIEHRANREEPLENKNLNLMAATVSDMLYEELQNFTKKIKQELNEETVN